MRYADDFVVLTTTYEEAVEAKTKLPGILKKRGLELSENQRDVKALTKAKDGHRYDYVIAKLDARDGVQDYTILSTLPSLKKVH